MLTSPITDARAWRASTLDDRSAWYYPLPERCLAALERAVREQRREQRPATELRAPDYLGAACAGALGPVLAALEHGRGFVILEGVPRERYTDPELQVIYWLVGQLLGRPFEQNVQGTLLYDVRDEGKDVRSGARFSVTRAESGFHTDNSFGEGVLDYVGLLCLHPARSGGLSQVVSGYTVHNELRARHPDALALLYEPFHIDRRGGLRPGDAPTSFFPILHWDGQGLICRYLRYWIEAGQEKAGQPLAARVRALDALDGVLGEPELRAEFGLKPGDMFFVNNRCLLHNRTAFEDHAEPERRRHYVRLWLRRDPRRCG
jgi:alpha-ketoglutarate-dependent taurine dioxygenase